MKAASIFFLVLPTFANSVQAWSIFTRSTAGGCQSCESFQQLCSFGKGARSSGSAIDSSSLSSAVSLCTAAGRPAVPSHSDSGLTSSEPERMYRLPRDADDCSAGESAVAGSTTTVKLDTAQKNSLCNAAKALCSSGVGDPRDWKVVSSTY